MGNEERAGHCSLPQAPFLNLAGRVIDRDLFPLPRFTDGASKPTGVTGRRAQQRLAKRYHVGCVVDECIDGLNTLYSGLPFGRSNNTGRASEAQMQVHEHILNSVVSLGPPGSIDGAEALQQLRAFDGYGDDQIPCAVKSYSPELLSLPAEGSVSIPLDDLLGSDGRDIVGDFIHSRLLCVDEARSLLANNGVRSAYSDPRLRDPKTYKGFIRRLLDADLVELHDEAPQEVVEAFFVGKKDGRLRMVIDCRRANCWFKKPDKVSLCTAEALSRIELEKDSQLYIQTADLKDAFYHFSLPVELRPYFGMRSVLAGDFGVGQINGVEVGPNHKLWPRLKVLPMGWSHALWWCQMIHQRIVLKAGASRDLCLEDKASVPDGRIMHLEYVDNYVVLGTCKEAVEQMASAGAAALREKGLVVHEEEKAEGSIKVLGWQFENTIMKPLPHRVWRVRLAIKQILTHGRTTGRQLEKIVGHAAFISLGRRESLSVFGETYTFIHRHYSYSHRLWKSVRRELQIYAAICPLIWRDLSSPWSSTVHSIDASNWGLGATRAEFQKEEVVELGRHSEKWRFSTEQFSKPRASTMGMEVASDLDEAAAYQWAAAETEVTRHGGRSGGDGKVVEPIVVVPPKSEDEKFSPLRFSTLKKDWTVVGRYKWKRLEPIPVLEARAALYGVKHVLRNGANFSKRHLILSDSITAVCSLDRGRGRAFKMRRVTQQVAAMCLGTNTSFHYRWLPSEWNTADGPSRGSKFPSDIVEHPGNGDSQADKFGKSSGQMSGEEGKHWQSEAKGHSRQEEQTCSADSRGGLVGERIGGSKVQAEISGMLGSPPARNRCSLDGEDQGTCGGQNLVSDVGQYVPGRRRHQPGQLHDSSSGVHVTSPSSAQTNESAGVKAVHSRMEETGSSRLTSPFAMGSSVSHGEVYDEAQHERTRPDDVDGLRMLSSSRRSCTVESKRFDPTCQQSQQVRKVVESDSAPAGKGTSIEDPGIRREHPVRLGVHSLHSKVGFPVARSGECAGQHNDLLQGGCRVTSCNDNSGDTVQSGDVGRRASIPPTSRGGIKGLCNSRKRPGANSAARPLEDNSFSEKVRKGWSVEPTASQPSSGRPSRGTRRKQADRKNHPIPALSPSRSLTVQVFLEIFCGCARLSHAVARITGWPVLMWDITLGSEYDLRKSSNRRLILEWVRCNWVVGFHLGTPCESFSRARDVPPGPPPLRSNDRPLGLDNLKPHDQLKVMMGNLFMRFSAALLILGWRLRVPGTLENPERSRLWLCPPIKAVLRKRDVQFAVTHFCGWGTPYRKATAFLGVHLNLDRLDNVRCRSSKRGICQYTGNHHVQLHGRNAEGQWLTKLAQPYPHRMCNALAKCFLDWELSVIAAQFSRHW